MSRAEEFRIGVLGPAYQAQVEAMNRTWAQAQKTDPVFGPARFPLPGESGYAAK